MESDLRFPRRSLSVVVFLCIILSSGHIARGTSASGTLRPRTNVAPSTSRLPAKNTAHSNGWSTSTSISVPADPPFRRRSLPNRINAEGTTEPAAGMTATTLVATDIQGPPALPDSTASPGSAPASTRSLRGPASDEKDEAQLKSYQGAFEKAYEQYLADYNAYMNVYYGAHASSPGPPSFHAGHITSGFKILPTGLPFFQTPPAGYPDFPYVFGYPVIFNGAGIIV